VRRLVGGGFLLVASLALRLSQDIIKSKALTCFNPEDYGSRLSFRLALLNSNRTTAAAPTMLRLESP